MLKRKNQHHDANQDPRRHTARHGFQRHQLRSRPRADDNPDRDHGIEIGRRGVIGDAERHRNPQYQQKTQRNARPPKKAGSHQRKACFTVAPQRGGSTEETARHFPQMPGLARASRGQFRDIQVSDHCASIGQRTGRKRGNHVPVGQNAAGDRTEQNRGNGGSFHQAVGLHQFVAGG